MQRWELAIVLLGLVVIELVAIAHTILHYPIALDLIPIAPSHILLAPTTPNVTVVLGSNETSANVTVITSNRLQLLQNPDFYSSPDYWLCIPGNYLSCNWSSSDIDASGRVVQIEGYIPLNGTSDAAFIVQSVTIPTTAQSIIIEARMKAFSLFVANYTWYLGLYDPETGIFYGAVNSTNLNPTYTDIAVNLTGSIVPGRTYYALVGINATSYNLSSWLPISLSAYIQLSIDSVYLYVNTSTYTFSGAVIGINTTNATAWGRLVFSQMSSQSGLNASLELFNATGASSGKLVVLDGIVQNVSTNWVILGPPPPGYTSGYVMLETSKTSPTNSTIYLLLELCYGGPGAGACTYYPLSVTIDPLRCLHHSVLVAKPIKLHIHVHYATPIGLRK